MDDRDLISTLTTELAEMLDGDWASVEMMVKHIVTETRRHDSTSQEGTIG